MKRDCFTFKFITILFLLVMVVSGCSTENQKEGTGNMSENNANEEKVELTTAVFGDVAIMEGWMKEIAEEIGVELDIQVLPDGEQNEQLYKTKAATQSLPDITLYHAGTKFKSDLVPEQNLVDLSKEPWVEKLDESVLSSYMVDGKVYGAPMGGATGFGGIYNYDLFEDLGLEIPTTHEDLIKVAKKIKEETDIIPLYISGADAWSLQIHGLMAFSTDMARNRELMSNINSNEETFLDAEYFIQAYETLEKMKDQGLINSDYLSATYANAQTAIAEGQAAIYFNAASLSGSLSVAYSDEELNKLGYFHYPSDGENVFSANPTYSLGIAVDSKNKKKALEFINFFMTEEGQQIYLDNQAGFALPALPDMEIDTSKYNTFLKRITEAYEGKEQYPSFESELIVNIGDFGPLVQEMLVGSKTPEAIAEAIQDTLEENAKAADIPAFKD